LSPLTKGMVTDPDPKLYLALKILKGDRGDGIMNVLSEDDSFVNNKRCSALTKKRIDKLLSEGYDNCSDPFIKRNWNRNRVLIDFQYIPKKITDRIIEQYQQPINGNKQKIFNYLIKHNCNLLLNDINAFVN